ncbi:MAG: hypothetical protein ABWK04_07335 [Hydrogenobacter sp.]|uniref:hypothetical protein n=1 Tax=Hydrogenobacter thermophilus TaxID=940 RepID=UPI0030F922BE
MKKLLGLIFSLLGVLLILLGCLTSFELYAKDRQRKINTDMANFILDIYRNKPTSKPLYPEYSAIIMKTQEGRVITTENLFKVFDESMYSSDLYKDKAGNEVYIYVKNPTLGEYIYFFMQNPLSFGVLLSGALFLVVGLFLLYTSPILTTGNSGMEEGLVNHLKALRLALSTSKIIPQESLERAKGILDDILKRYGGKV